jgi:hypothetical protein
MSSDADPRRVFRATYTGRYAVANENDWVSFGPIKMGGHAHLHQHLPWHVVVESADTDVVANDPEDVRNRPIALELDLGQASNFAMVHPGPDPAAPALPIRPYLGPSTYFAQPLSVTGGQFGRVTSNTIGCQFQDPYLLQGGTIRFRLRNGANQLYTAAGIENVCVVFVFFVYSP